MIYDLSIFFFWFPCCPKSVDAFCVQFVRLKLKPLVLLNDLVRGGNEWSSGHVAILVVNFLLRTLRDKPQAFQLKGLKIPDWAVGEDAINLLCGQGVPGLLSVNAELGKTDHEMRQPLPPPKRAKHESAGDVPLQPKIESKHEPKSENHHGPHSAGEQEPEEQNENRKRQQNETEAENVPVRKAQRIERASARAVPVSNTNEANAVVQSAIDLLSSRSIRAADRRLEKNAKMILGKCGLDFNYHFQPAHKGKLEAGHWSSFLKGVMGKEDIACLSCQALIQKFEVDRIRTMAEQTGQLPQPVAMELPEGDEGPCLALVPLDTVVSPPQKRTTAGRPRRGEECDLESKRAGIYRFLDRAEATQRLPKHKKENEQQIREEMSKRPCQCMLCGVYFHMPVLTNNMAMKLVR